MLYPEHAEFAGLHFPADGTGYANADRGITDAS